ncbi:hypothetical protein K435DRAFT_256564 [Dendrothele bispora CBS 962.96]|uniref:Uncharacterized protein n=1 Tax=Dendrothele bispora (strain CBS 962.96) TaxID=1314807 RepID=A0A4S8LNB7_DENBC|nr:hypothetical protein K435DRAFT_256564 [Dendrothele bispora CBS 962.96]
MTTKSLSMSLPPTQAQIIEAGYGIPPLKSPSSPCSPRSPRLRRRPQSILRRPPPLRLSRTLNPFAPRDIILVLSPPPTTTRGSTTGTRSGKVLNSGRKQTAKRSDTPLITSPHVHFPPSAKLTSLILSSSRFPLSGISSASSRYSDEGEGLIIVSPNPPLENSANEKENMNDDVLPVKRTEKGLPPSINPSLSASPSFYRYPNSPYPISENEIGSPTSTASSYILSPRLPFSPAPNQKGVNEHHYTSLRLFQSIHVTLANEPARHPVQLDKALKAYPRSPYPTATFDSDHHRLGDSEEDDDMDMDVVADKVPPPRHIPVRANTIAVPATHRGRDRTVKALGSHSTVGADAMETTGSGIEKDTVMTPVAMSIAVTVPASASASCAISVPSSNLDVVDMPIIPIAVSPKSVASNTSIVSGLSGTSLRNAFWQSLSLEEGLQEEDEDGEEGKVVKGADTPSLLLGAPSPLGKEFDAISRPNLPMPPVPLGTMDGDVLRWPDSSVSRSSLVDVPLSPFDPPHAQMPQRISACQQAQVKANRASKKRLTLPLGTPTESEWLSWKSEFSASTRPSGTTARSKRSSVPSFYVKSPKEDDDRGPSEVNSIPFPEAVVMSPSPRAVKDRLPSFTTSIGSRNLRSTDII